MKPNKLGGIEITNQLEDVKINVKIKLSILWLFGEVTLLTFLVLELLEQGVITGIIAGDMKGLPLGPETLLFYAVSL